MAVPREIPETQPAKRCTSSNSSRNCPSQGDIPEAIAAKLRAFPWRFQVYHPKLAQVREEALLFAADVLAGRPKRWLSLLGQSGVVKTLMSKDLIRFLERHWIRIVTQRHEDGGTSGRGPTIVHLVPAKDLTDYQSVKEYATRDLVYVEDVGAGQFGDRGAGAVTKGRVTELLQLRTGKWTLLDANLYRKDIDSQLDACIASRLKRDGSACVEISENVPRLQRVAVIGPRASFKSIAGICRIPLVEHLEGPKLTVIARYMKNRDGYTCESK